MIIEDEKKAWEMYLLGIPQTKIAIELGVSRSTISRFIKKYINNPYDFKDELVGKRFGKLVVLGATKDNGQKKYKCLCDCGKETLVTKGHLISGHTKSCGCLKTDPRKDLTEKRFGNLLVLRKIEHTKKGLYEWECLCNCGKKCIVSTSDLVLNRVKSCGCINQLHLEGKRFGKLTVIEQTDKRKEGEIIWRCECDCGGEIYTNTSNLTQGHTKSCGCLKSWKEIEIQKLLNKYNINFQSQFSFDDLIGDSRKLRFDFAIFDKKEKLYCLIEYQGEQHTDKFNLWNTDKLKKYDNKKKQYCENNKIKLIELNKNSDLEMAIKELQKGIEYNE